MFLAVPLTNFLWHIVLANSLLLILLTVFIYRNTKDKTFLWYAIYNSALLLYIIPKNSEIIYFSFLDSPRIKPLSWGIQIVYNSFLTYFGMEFLNFKTYFPKLRKIADIYLKTLITIGVLGCLLAVAFNQNYYYFLFFTYFYLPVSVSVGLYFLYLATKVTENTRHYYFLGVFSYMFFAIVAFVLTITKHIYIWEEFTAISLFYIGILIESICFTFGLGERVKIIYKERLSIQKELTVTQQKLNKQLQEKIEKIEIEKKLTDLEFALMTSKMNSHFLFNTLNSIKLFIIENDVKNAIAYLGKFSEFIRKVLETSSIKWVTLEDELYTSKLYVDIENIRFNNEIDFTIKITDESILTQKVPPFILQPFLENAIWHGIATKQDKKITLLVVKKQDKIHIEVEDNGVGRKKATALKKARSSYKKSVGLTIINEILTNAYQQNYSLQFVDLSSENNETTGTKVVLELPVKMGLPI